MLIDSAGYKCQNKRDEILQDRFTQSLSKPLLVCETVRERARKNVQKVFAQKIEHKCAIKCFQKVRKSVQKCAKIELKCFIPAFGCEPVFGFP